ncbi:4-carboxymuconolactone decarboxylase [Streptomyces sp. SAI-135]|uniref:carboxymuconolactone decarboxylase family protein n=1 Tax=unclassified Streptomyces TaxID=2593676 RepID=UPI0024742C80|nr:MULTISPECIES: carboxymuconolactone decarboxylase family protein [unclassified Streptomyces]MDH6523082.1 4-carboxymuconolactone decarboxylase [Streptomyces sp. SAI-090]MDH6554694.1 4-carboxymuconolactone decarboxylase [Streptomyces sp. SAI-041]MDH6573965.1 4-carboxymuconolactone decarboxylase [Streptomyces sp. SAI-117]MDH6581298.1 4-carboxymuconolactone decarboxylase [Streptomyces sp. SAI-133]MDH6613304.1 4-carboxymuconolactone decarboxylase [Streptomyces sp. SAI-135]
MSAPQAAGPGDETGGQTPAGRAAHGQAAMAEIMQMTVPDITDPDSIGGLAAQHIYGDLWQRPVLSRRERRLVTLTVLAVLSQNRLHTPLHIKAALDSGDLSEADLRESAIQIAFYAGWPLATSFDAAIDAVTGSHSRYDQVNPQMSRPASGPPPRTQGEE